MKESMPSGHIVFVSNSGTDAWVARQIAREIISKGVTAAQVPPALRTRRFLVRSDPKDTADQVASAVSDATDIRAVWNEVLSPTWPNGDVS